MFIFYDTKEPRFKLRAKLPSSEVTTKVLHRFFCKAPEKLSLDFCDEQRRFFPVSCFREVQFRDGSLGDTDSRGHSLHRSMLFYSVNK